MRKLIGIISTLAVLGVVAVAILNNGNYHSILDKEAAATCNIVEYDNILHSEAKSPLPDNGGNEEELGAE